MTSAAEGVRGNAGVTSSGAPAIAPIVRYSFYAFIASIPFESVDWGGIEGVFSLSKIFGWTFFFCTLLQARVVWGRTPSAVWCIAAYLFVFSIRTILGEEVHDTAILHRLAQQVQFAVLLWALCNILREVKVARGMLLAIASSCTIVALLVQLGVGLREQQWSRYTRTAFLAEGQNSFALVMAGGLLALVAPHYARLKFRNYRLYTVFSVMGALLIGLSIAGTGSRGATVALAVAFITLSIFSTARRTRLGGMGLAIVFGVLITYSVATTDTMRARFEHTLETGHTAGRTEIMLGAVNMFLEKPVLGWGPEEHNFELGRRTGAVRRDTHNVYLWVLVETGSVGGIAFIAAMYLCAAAAWRARYGPHGAIPLALIILFAVAGLSGTNHNRKLFWIAMALGSAASVSMRARRYDAPRGAILNARARHRPLIADRSDPS